MKFSLSRSIFISLLFFVLGIGIGTFLPVPFFVYMPFCFLIVIFLFFYLKKDFKNIFLIYTLFLLFGIFWYQISIPSVNPNHISFYKNKEITFQGRVVKEKEQRLKNDKLTLGNIKISDKNIKGRVLVNASNYSKYRYGDVLNVTCYLKIPEKFNNFDYKMYLARYGIYSLCYYPKIKKVGESSSFFYKNILKIRQNSKKIINKFLPEPQSSILNALILGYKKSFPDDLRENFAKAGLSHVLAISGLHIAVLISILMVLFSRVLGFNTNLSFILNLIFIIIFVILVGMPASAVRAAIMGFALLLSQKLNRNHESLRVLLLTACLMLFINPKLLGWDIGFQFSFLAVLGIYFLTPLFQRILKKIPDLSFFPIRSFLSISLGAQLMVLPLVLFYFGHLSLIAPLSNILVLFMVPILMIFGFLFLMFSFIFIGLGNIFVWPVFILLTYVVLVVNIACKMPYFSFTISNFPLFLAIIFYLILIFIIIKNFKLIRKK